MLQKLRRLALARKPVWFGRANALLCRAERSTTNTFVGQYLQSWRMYNRRRHLMQVGTTFTFTFISIPIGSRQRERQDVLSKLFYRARLGTLGRFGEFQLLFDCYPALFWSMKCNKMKRLDIPF